MYLYLDCVYYIKCYHDTHHDISMMSIMSMISCFMSIIDNVPHPALFESCRRPEDGLRVSEDSSMNLTPLPFLRPPLRSELRLLVGAVPGGAAPRRAAADPSGSGRVRPRPLPDPHRPGGR